jgi:LAO/AO transport system kinase
MEGGGAAGGGALAAKRAEQARAWMWSEVSETLVAALSARPEVARQLAGLEDQVRAGTITPAAAAARLLEAFRGGA